jgi:hypothetical protein
MPDLLSQLKALQSAVNANGEAQALAAKAAAANLAQMVQQAINAAAEPPPPPPPADPPPPPVTLPAPANFTATLSPDGKRVDLAWDAVPGANHYVLHRSSDGSDPDDGIPIEFPTSTSFTDSRLVPGTTYRYCPAAADVNGDVGPCSPDVMVMVPATPTDPGTPPPMGTPVKLTGTPFGTPGSYADNGNTFAKVFDGDPLTWFDAPVGDGGYVGIDLGTAQAVGTVKYAPRPDMPERMVGGRFQGSNTSATDGYVDLYTVTDQPPAGVLTVATFANDTPYRWVRYIAPDGSYGGIAEMEVWAGTVLPAEMLAVMDLAMDADVVVGAGETKLLMPGNYNFKRLRIEAGGFLDIPRGGVNVVCEDVLPMSGSRFRIGRPDARIPRSDPVTFTFSNASGPLLPDPQDPLHLRRGFIAMGATVEFYGELPKLLPQDKMNWWDGTKWTVVDCPWADKTPGEPDLTAPDYKARAIRFMDEVPGPTTGSHFMFMHEQKSVTLSGCYFKIGRTDKSVVVTDPVWGKPETYGNVRGRYSGPHAHRTGPDGIEHLWEYNVSEDGQSWGFDNHDSRVRARWNLDVNCYGAGYNNELGTEVSFVDGHASERVRGDGDFGGDRGAKDHGHNGAAVWTQDGGGIGYSNDVRPGGSASAALTQIHFGDTNIPITRIRKLADGPAPDYAPAADALEALLKQWPNARTARSFALPFFVRRLVAPDSGHLAWALQNPDDIGTYVPPVYSVMEDCVLSYLESVYSNNARFVRNQIRSLQPYTTYGYNHTGVVAGQHFEDCEFLDHNVGIHCPTKGENLIRGGRFRNICDILVTNQWHAGFPDLTDPNNPKGRTIEISGTIHLPLPDGVDPKSHVVKSPWGRSTLTPGHWFIACRPWFTEQNIENYLAMLPADPGIPDLFHWKSLWGYSRVLIENPNQRGDMWYLYPDEMCEDYEVVRQDGTRVLPLSDEVLKRPDGTLRKTSGEIFRETEFRLWGTEPLPRITLPGVLGIVSRTPAKVIADPKLPSPATV